MQSENWSDARLTGQCALGLVVGHDGSNRDPAVLGHEQVLVQRREVTIQRGGRSAGGALDGGCADGGSRFPIFASAASHFRNCATRLQYAVEYPRVPPRAGRSRAASHRSGLSGGRSPHQRRNPLRRVPDGAPRLNPASHPSATGAADQTPDRAFDHQILDAPVVDGLAQTHEGLARWRKI